MIKTVEKKKSWPDLYRLNAAGKVMVWGIGAHWKEGEPGQYIVVHGQYGGKLQTTSTKVHKGMNIGKANETSVWEQTVAEAQSHWNKQKDRKGYSETIPSAKPLRPMLAKSYDDHADKIEFPCYWQPKLDGIRCLAFLNNQNLHSQAEVVLMSRQGKEFKALDHIKQALLPILSQDLDIILDGELYRHGEEFQELASLIKRDKPHANSHRVQYHVYDLVSDDDYSDRFNRLWQIIPQNIHHTKRVVDLVWTQKLEHKGQVQITHDSQKERGFEGIMLRNAKGGYQIDRRSSDLQKVKMFKDAEFEIVGAEENKGKMEGQCSFICITKNGTEFKVKPEGSDAVREKYWEDWQKGKLKGKMLTVRYFAMTTSANPVPRFPVGVAIRDYE